MCQAQLRPLVIKVIRGAERNVREPERCHVVEVSLDSCCNFTRYRRGPVRTKHGELLAENDILPLWDVLVP